MELLKHKYFQFKLILLTPLCWQFWSGMADDSPLSGRVVFPPFSTRIGVMRVRARLPGGGGIAGVHGQAGGTFYSLSPGVPGAAEKLRLQLRLHHRSSQNSLCSSYFREGLQPSCKGCWGCGHCKQREQSRITPVHAQMQDLCCWMVSPYQGTPGLCKETLEEREVPPRGVPVWSGSGPLLGVPESSQVFWGL